MFSKSALRRKREFVSVDGHRLVLSALDKAHDELAIMKKVRHFNIISCYEIIDDAQGDGLYLGMRCRLHALLLFLPCFPCLLMLNCCHSSRICFWWTSHGLDVF